MTGIAFTEADRVTIEQLLHGFHPFLNHVKFKGDARLWTTALMLDRTSACETLVDASEIEAVYAWLAWQLSFGKDVRPLWLMRDPSRDPRVLKVMAYIDRLGKFAPEMDRINERMLRVRETHSQLNVSPIYPNAGRGLSLTHLIIEDCLYLSDEWKEMVENLSPVMHSVTQGKGRIITIQP